MYAVYKQAHPPTGLEFSMYCNFFNNSERNLVVAGTSQLYVYRLNRDAEVGPPAAAARRGCPSPTAPGWWFSSPLRYSASPSSWWAWRPALGNLFALLLFRQVI